MTASSLTAITLLVLLAVATALWTAPRWLLGCLSKRSPRCVYMIPTGSKAVALTLDDGPDPTHTHDILRILREHDARATFFLLSAHVRGNEALVSSIVGGGHELGNHLTDDEPSHRLSPEAFSRAAREAGELLERFGPVRWLRPGSAWHDSAMIDRIERAGYRCALGSVYPYDPYVPFVRLASAYILANVRPGAVIVLHERGGRGRRTARTLRRVLPVLRTRGYRVLSLSGLDELARSPTGVDRSARGANDRA